MSEPLSPNSSPPTHQAPNDRLDSWKEIAAYLNRDVTTVQRWEKREGMPVHRHVHDKMGSVYAFRADLDAWAQGRKLGLVTETAQGRPRPSADESAADQSVHGALPRTLSVAALLRQRGIWLLLAAAAIVSAALVAWQAPRPESRTDPLAEGRFLPLTDFGGTEQAAALSRDGRFAAFLSDRDGQVDVWVTQVGTGQFHNLTHGTARELVNPSVRTLGFSPDGTEVTFWARKSEGSNRADISIWAASILGGEPRPYLNGAAELDWSGDGTRLAYHTPGPGDPLFIGDSGEPSKARQIFSAPPGLHAHFPAWSPDQQFIYFVLGSVPDRMDIWRIRPSGGAPERITNHDSVVSHPVFLNARTLMYLAGDADGSGPWIYSLDVEDRMPRRVSAGLDRFTSLAASADGTRLVATVARPKGTLWRVPVTGTRADASTARRIPLTTGSGTSPRFGGDYLLYVSSKGATDSIWKLQGDRASELWSAPETRIVGGPAVAPGGHQIVFSTRQNGHTRLYVANDDGTDARAVPTGSLELQGSPAWAPGGQSITVAAVVDGSPRLFNVPLDGRSPTPLVRDYSVDPVWSHDGDIVAFSGPDIGTTFPVTAVKADTSSYHLPAIRLTRGARHLVFMPGRRSLAVLRGDIRHKNLWLIDLEDGAEHQLTDLAPDFDVRDFDVSPDGREIVLEQVEEQSDIVLLEVPRR